MRISKTDLSLLCSVLGVLIALGLGAISVLVVSAFLAGRLTR